MEISFEQLSDNIKLVTLVGRLDMMGAQSIDLKFTSGVATGVSGVVVDLSGVSFLASLGIRTLISPAKALKARGGKMVLLNPQPLVLEVLKVSGLTAILPVYTDVAEAVAALG
jgi:anti-sigma B factor antagonist